MRTTRQFWNIACAAAAVLSIHTSALPQDSFPIKPIRIIVPYAAGGAGDIVARAVGGKAAELLGQSAVVEAKPGGNTVIGTQDLLRSPPDGHTWLLAAPALSANPSLFKKTPWKIEDFIGVGIAVRAPAIVVIPADVPASSLEEFVALAKRSPGKFNYGNPSVGSSMHLNTELFKQTAELDIVSIVYKGQPPALLALLQGDVSIMFPSVGLAMPHIQSGKLKALATVSNDRLPVLPNVRTLTEAGYSEANVVPWYGFVIRAGTPPDVARKVNESISKALATQEVQQVLRNAGFLPERGHSVDEVQAAIRSDFLKYREAIVRGNLGSE